jgi:hypothetical protein
MIGEASGPDPSMVTACETLSGSGALAGQHRPPAPMGHPEPTSDLTHVADREARALMAVADMVFSQLGWETERRDELANAVAAFFAGLPVATPAALDPNERVYLASLADFITRARSSVVRGAHGDEVQYVPAPESLGRVLRVLAGLVGGLQAIGTGPVTTWDLVTRTAFDSIPALRLRCLRALLAEDGQTFTASVGERISYPTSTARRALDDLAAHGLVVRDGHRWGLTAATRERMQTLGVEPWGS